MTMQILHGSVKAPLRLLQTFLLCSETQFSQGFQSKVSHGLSNQLLTGALKGISCMHAWKIRSESSGEKVAL